MEQFSSHLQPQPCPPFFQVFLTLRKMPACFAFALVTFSHRHIFPTDPILTFNLSPVSSLAPTLSSARVSSIHHLANTRIYLTIRSCNLTFCFQTLNIFKNLWCFCKEKKSFVATLLWVARNCLVTSSSGTLLCRFPRRPPPPAV